MRGMTYLFFAAVVFLLGAIARTLGDTNTLVAAVTVVVPLAFSAAAIAAFLGPDGFKV